MKKIEIEKKKKLPKNKVKSLDLNIDFSSIKQLVGNKLILEMIFQETKMELING